MFTARMHTIGLVATCLAICLASNTGCRPARNLVPPPPVVFQQPPSLPELLTAVNAHSDQIHDLQTDSGRLSARGYPTSLRANLRVLRPNHLRLRANMLGNPVVDMGSNDERFWMWSSNSPVLFARHSQFASSAAGRVLPVEPTWLVEAMGLIHFDPQGAHRGPFQRDDGMIEVHTQVPSGLGQRIRVVAIHPQYGYITEVQLRDGSGRLLAIAKAGEHRYDEVQQVTLPHRVHLELVTTTLPIKSFTFEANDYVVNQLQSAEAHPNLWTMPAGPAQDLAAGPPPAGSGRPMSSNGMPRHAPSRTDVGFRPEYRGYQR